MIVRDWRVAAIGGVAALVVGWVLLNDAYEKRGRRPPFLLRPFTW